jgi:hypothetical protein
VTGEVLIWTKTFFKRSQSVTPNGKYVITKVGVLQGCTLRPLFFITGVHLNISSKLALNLNAPWISCLNLTSLFALFVFLLFSWRKNLNEHPIIQMTLGRLEKK